MALLYCTGDQEAWSILLRDFVALDRLGMRLYTSSIHIPCSYVFPFHTFLSDVHVAAIVIDNHYVSLSTFVFASLIGLANVCIVTDCMTLTQSARIEVNIPRKRKRSCSDHHTRYVAMLSSYNPKPITCQVHVYIRCYHCRHL